MIEKKHKMPLIVALLGILMITAVSGIADANEPASARQEQTPDELEGFDTDADFEGDDPFGSIDTSVPDDLNVKQPRGPFMIGGYAELDSEYGFNKANEKLSKLMPQLFVEAEYQYSDAFRAKVSGKGFYDVSYTIEDRDKHNGLSQDDEEYAFELRDAYIDGRISHALSLRIGRQVVAWGDSDYARITDVINPRDLTSPGLIDLEDARLPVAAARLTFDSNPFTLEAVTVHEHQGSRISGKGADFDYYKVLRSGLISISDKDTPDKSFENTGFAVKSKFAFNGGDVSLTAASTFDDTPVLRYDGLFNGIMSFTPEYDRFTTFGISSSLARGSFLYKLEAAYRLDRKMTRNDILAQIEAGIPRDQVRTTNSEDQFAALAGIEHTGFPDLRLSLETLAVYTLNYNNDLSAEENEFATYFQATKDLLNQTLELDLLLVSLHPGDGSILRLSGAYDLTDSWEIRAGVAFYEADRSSADLHPYKDQDRVFFRIKYSF
jgi:hypothetical protein